MYCNVHWLTLSLLHVLLGLPFCPRRNKLKLIHYVHSYVCRKYKQCFFGHCITLRLSFKSFRGRTVIGSSTVCTACIDNDVSDSVIDHHCIPSPLYFIVCEYLEEMCEILWREPENHNIFDKRYCLSTGLASLLKQKKHGSIVQIMESILCVVVGYIVMRQ